MFTEKELMQKAKEICDEFNLPYPNKIEYNNRIKKTLGSCNIQTKIIKLSTAFCKLNNDETIIKLLKHELVHLKYYDHGRNFKNLNYIIGGITNKDKYEIPYNWLYICPKCKYSYGTINKERKTYICKKCAKDDYDESCIFIETKVDR